MTLTVEPPTDKQLGYIAGLCEERGLDFPEAVHSVTEASEIIAAILSRTYEPMRYRPVPARLLLDVEAEDVPF